LPPVAHSVLGSDHFALSRLGIPSRGGRQALADEKVIGYTQQIPGGHVFEIANSWLSRRIHCISGRIATTSLCNAINGEDYLDETLAEFEITITGEGRRATLDHKDFELVGYSTPNWSDSVRTLQLDLEADINDVRVPVSVFYELRAGAPFMRKWLQVKPCELENFVVRSVTIEHMRFREMVEGVTPLNRYTKRYPNGEDRVQTEPDHVNTDQPDRRFYFGDLARAVVAYWGYGEGLFFFTESLTGVELFHRPNGLIMKHRDFSPLDVGLTTGPAVIGAYVGPPEIGFKRYREHLAQHWCVVDEKTVPVTWNTWLVTLEGDRPLHADYDRRFLFDVIDELAEAGFYECLHLDLGWEAGYPLQYDQSKFPNGLSEIARRAKEVAGLDMGYWINPFSCSYWRSEIERERPDYLVPGKVSPRSGATALCVMTDYRDYVRQRIIDLAVGLNARVIYWDGNDFNIPECSSDRHEHRDQEELEVKAARALAEICDAAHDARPDLIIAAFSLPFDNHRLRSLDCQAISDTHSFPTVQSELIWRQQLYQMAFEHPYRAIWGSWYGVSWHEAGPNNLARPFAELKHAAMSMIGCGLAHAGASIDLSQAGVAVTGNAEECPPASSNAARYVELLRNLFAFRKRFARYFDTYQHVLGFPDGRSVDGEGHIVDGSGFIVLINPTLEERTVRLPLDEPGLELDSTRCHELSDWSSLTEGTPLASASISNPPTFTLEPLEVKYVGVNVT